MSDEVLIESVQAYTFLYDPSKRFYHDNIRRENAWDEVSKKTGISDKNRHRQKREHSSTAGTSLTDRSSDTQKTISAIKNNEKIYKVIVIGDSNVGKTTLTYRFCEGKFLDYSEATIGVDFRSRTLDIDGEPITLQLWDTAGQERYRLSMVRHYYRNTDAVILVYDVTNTSSFASLKKWVEESNMNCMPDIPKILIGNKCDEAVAVPTNEAQKFADMHDMPLFETSARLDSECDNVESIFLTLAHKLKNQRRFLQPATNPLRITGQIVNDTTAKKSWCC